MKYLAGFLFSLLITNSALATGFVDLCDASCDLLITFPDGGSIVADEDLTLIFGTGGELRLGDTGTVNVNPQPLSLDFSTGGTLALAKGESITFDTGGSIVLGWGGNISYTNISINSAGGFSVKAVGNTEKIVINNVTISGSLITLTAKLIDVIGNLIIDVDSALFIIAETGGSESTVCAVEDTSNGVILSAGNFIDTGDTCNTIGTDLNLVSGELTLVAIDPNANLTGVADITLNPDQTLPLDADDITLNDIAESSSNGIGAAGFLWLLSLTCLLCCRRRL